MFVYTRVRERLRLRARVRFHASQLCAANYISRTRARPVGSCCNKLWKLKVLHGSFANYISENWHGDPAMVAQTHTRARARLRMSELVNTCCLQQCSNEARAWPLSGGNIIATRCTMSLQITKWHTWDRNSASAAATHTPTHRVPNPPKPMPPQQH